MNKTKIKNFAIEAREKLIADITYKAGMLGITDSGIAEELPQSTADLKFFDVGTKEYAEVSGNAIRQRDALVKAIREKEKDCGKYKEAFEFVVEEVAYTWFNRLVAIRFMEVNDYLPSGIRVLSSENKAKVEPDFVTTPFDTDLEFTPFEQDHIIELKDKNKLDELFRKLFIKQCNKLHEILPKLFEKTDDYTELLLTISFTDKDGIVYRLTHDVDEDDFNVEKEGQIEIIGWMYQFYNSVPKDTVFANLKKNKKIRKEDIPAATQLFTPDWIVRYMVENSLGRLWVEGHPNKELKNNWKYYLEEAQQEESVEKQLEEIRKEYSAISPEEVKLIDPCMGSGHILVYAFDVLMQIYDSMGYTARDAVRNIVENNIYGLDIDKRAAQLSYFAMMMKARQYDRRFLGRNIQPNVYAIRESNGLDQYAVDYFCNGDSTLIKAINSILSEMHDAKEYGSIIDVTPVDFEALYVRFKEVEDDINMSREVVLNELLPLVQVSEVMAQEYDTVITNPPYMGGSGMDANLSNFVKKNYPDSKSDLFTVFIEKCGKMTKKNGYQAMITMHSWMFITSYEKLRSKLLNHSIVNMAHLGARAFDEIGGEVVQTTSFVIQKTHLEKRKAIYKRLIEGTSEANKEQLFLSGNFTYQTAQTNFHKIPGYPYAYWISDHTVELFEQMPKLGELCISKTGMTTGDNNRFLREWYEIENEKIGSKWFFYNKGGGYRKWYGGIDFVIIWENNGSMVKAAKCSTIRNPDFYFRECISWNLITTDRISVRMMKPIFVMGDAGPACYIKSDKDKWKYLGLLNSVVADYLLKIINPTINYSCGVMEVFPVCPEKINEHNEIVELTQFNVNMSQKDWDSYETSSDFERHPLVLSACDKKEQEQSQFAASRMEKLGSLLWQYERYKAECEDRFQTLKSNEEELNRIFIDIYGLQEELTPKVEDKDVTVYRIFDSKEEIPESMGSSKYSLTKQDVVKDLISYAVGCMLGRYSLDMDGLAFAGGEWDDSKYTTFIPDADNCIPLTDEEYFEDDIVGRFVKFIEVVYGKDTLEENLNFIADALGNKGKTSREVIRNYFLNDFIKDHIKKYQKRPIYWLFDSGKQNGFKALVYMHRWNEDTVGHLRVEYLHKMQRVYEKEIERMQEVIDNSKDNKEISVANKRKEKLQKQLKETKDYDAKIAHIALSRIDIDLDDGVKVNYEKVQTVDGKNMQILSKL